MKKRALFCIENFHQGGINRALENILSLHDKETLEINLFVVNQEDGPYKKAFAPYVKYEPDSLLSAYCTYLSKHSGLRKTALMLIKAYRKLAIKFGKDPFKKRLNYWAKKIESDKYDCVIAYAEGYITEFVSHVRGHKASWIHIDYKRYLHYVNDIDEGNIYRNFDEIVIPSRFSGVSFKDIYPDLKEKICIIPNLIDSLEVKRKSLETQGLDDRFTPSPFTIISVGRICYEKRFFEIPRVAKSLKDKGVGFRWYIIGDGSEIEKVTLHKAITDTGTENIVIPLGGKDNPYPYIAQSDILVSTSLSETFSYVVFEAKSLGVPVVCADFGTSEEILNEREGVISTIDEMADKIYALVDKNKTIKVFKDYLKTYQYDNNQPLEQIYDVISNSKSNL